MNYLAWLAGMSLVFVAAERVWPRERRPVLRKGLLSDVAFFFFNAEAIGMFFAIAAAFGRDALNRALDLANLRDAVYFNAAAGWPLWAQIILLVLVKDFVQWLIHRSLHSFEILWRFHKVHHSIQELDWIGNWRFHWFEVFYYQALLYVPLVFFGFSGKALFIDGMFSIFIGHLAHSNLRFNLGPLIYVINTPQMHWWHHNHPSEGPMHRNFGIALSVWDWIFGTAHVPDHDPARLGFPDIETYPRNILTMWLEPFRLGREN
jgi:sterol desaturase/sphingolipid hydroxylase (fatty acid hydroxylase superfamily)